jgi:hypothetical protein
MPQGTRIETWQEGEDSQPGHERSRDEAADEDLSILFEEETEEGTRPDARNLSSGATTDTPADAVSD